LADGLFAARNGGVWKVVCRIIRPEACHAFDVARGSSGCPSPIGLKESLAFGFKIDEIVRFAITGTATIDKDERGDAEL
jgi:hypothetical protein